MITPRPDRIDIRLAGRVISAVAALHSQRRGRVADVTPLSDSLETLNDTLSRLRFCHERGFHAAECQVRECVVHELNIIAEYARFLQLQFSPQNSPVETDAPTIRDVLAELRQIHDEFGGYTYRPRDATLAVRTEDITLEGVALGPFEIRLDLSLLSKSVTHRPYSVTALDPRPAAAEEDVTHPHVRDELLCEGNASAPITAALLSGRLCDFFVLVRSVLSTYNASSPYIRLDEWSGVACHDCGEIDAEATHCRSCEYEYCGQCSSYCDTCEEPACGSCVETCPACRGRVCPSCSDNCGTCHHAFCTDCLIERTCPDCLKPFAPSPALAQGIQTNDTTTTGDANP